MRLLLLLPLAGLRLQEGTRPHAAQTEAFSMPYGGATRALLDMLLKILYYPAELAVSMSLPSEKQSWSG